MIRRYQIVNLNFILLKNFMKLLTYNQLPLTVSIILPSLSPIFFRNLLMYTSIMFELPSKSRSQIFSSSIVRVTTILGFLMKYSNILYSFGVNSNFSFPFQTSLVRVSKTRSPTCILGFFCKRFPT